MRVSEISITRCSITWQGIFLKCLKPKLTEWKYFRFAIYGRKGYHGIYVKKVFKTLVNFVYNILTGAQICNFFTQKNRVISVFPWYFKHFCNGVFDKRTRKHFLIVWNILQSNLLMANTVKYRTFFPGTGRIMLNLS